MFILEKYRKWKLIEAYFPITLIKILLSKIEKHWEGMAYEKVSRSVQYNYVS